MHKPYQKDDPTWESVLESLASQGYLSKFYKIPRHELSAMMKIYGRKGVETLGRIFILTQQESMDERAHVIAHLSDHLRFVMLAQLVRSMKCWVETESFTPGATRSSWRVAHS